MPDADPTTPTSAQPVDPVPVDAPPVEPPPVDAEVPSTTSVPGPDPAEPTDPVGPVDPGAAPPAEEGSTVPGRGETRDPARTNDAVGSGGGATIEAEGIAARLPTGWDGVIYQRDVEDIGYGADVPPDRRRQPTSRAVLHAANFPLPVSRGDYGSGAVERMIPPDILVVVFEFEPSSASELMFASSGIPRRVDPEDFDPNQMQRAMPGMAGFQRFFNIDGRRAFCVYIVIGSYADRETLAARATEALAGIEIS